MDEIYKLVGQIIEVCQYIELVLQSVVASKSLLQKADFDGEMVGTAD